LPDGRIVTWGQDLVDGEPRLWGRWRGGSGQQWDSAERLVMSGGAINSSSTRIVIFTATLARSSVGSSNEGSDASVVGSITPSVAET